MSELLQVVVLALVQGLTEFLPISSSAHLILLPMLAQFPDQGLAFDVAVHVGTLLAVIFYFRQKLKWMLFGFLRSFVSKRPRQFHARLSWMLVFASIPIAVGGLLLHSHVETFLRSPLVIAYASIVFGLVLYAADRMNTQTKTMHQLNFKSAMTIGLLQILALIPGTSRSGITLTGGLWLGFNRKAAATFSFLLSIPAIVMAGGYESIKLFSQPQTLPLFYFILGASISALSALICIDLFLKLINRIGLLPFVIYRIILGILLIAVFHA